MSGSPYDGGAAACLEASLELASRASVRRVVAPSLADSDLRIADIMSQTPSLIRRIFGVVRPIGAQIVSHLRGVLSRPSSERVTISGSQPVSKTIEARRVDPQDLFSTETAGLSDVSRPSVIRLHDGDRFDLRISPARKGLDAAVLRMLAYNGSIPGPTLHVDQGSEITVQVTNDGDIEATVHWHGLRLENRYDGVPHETQAPIPIGGTFTYKVQFPDAGLYWYPPHIREDFAQEMGLYGTIVVEPSDPSYWPAVDRQLTLTLDDLLVEGGQIAPFRRSTPTFTAMGRFGNVLLINGETAFSGEAALGEGVRLSDAHPTAEHQAIGHAVERAPDKVLAFISSMPLLYGEDDKPASTYACPMHPEVTAAEPATCPKCGMKLLPVQSKTVVATSYICPMHPGVTASKPGRCPKCWMKLVVSDVPATAAAKPHDGPPHGGHQAGDGLEWEDLMPAINRASDPSNMIWKLVDRETLAENGAIAWAVGVGDRVKIRLVNEMESDHPMHHPFHIHGAGRFLILSRDGNRESNLVWKDTVLLRAGQTVDILLDVTHPGLWMAHCHIAEHTESGMMFSFDVSRRGSMDGAGSPTKDVGASGPRGSSHHHH